MFVLALVRQLDRPRRQHAPVLFACPRMLFQGLGFPLISGLRADLALGTLSRRARLAVTHEQGLRLSPQARAPNNPTRSGREFKSICSDRCRQRARARSAEFRAFRRRPSALLVEIAVAVEVFRNDYGDGHRRSYFAPTADHLWPAHLRVSRPRVNAVERVGDVGRNSSNCDCMSSPGAAAAANARLASHGGNVHQNFPVISAAVAER